jgi:hypothetical protein
MTNNCNQDPCCDDYGNNDHTPTPPECNEPCTTCDEVTPSECVVYTGPNIECIGVTTGMPLNTVINLMAAKACEEPEPPQPPEPPAPTTCANIDLSAPAEGCQSPVQYMLNNALAAYCNQEETPDCELYPEDVSSSNNKPECKSVVEYLTDYVFANTSPDDEIPNWTKVFTEVMTNGIIISNNNCDTPLCCHECCEDGYYILSGMNTALAIFNILGEPSCCANTYFSAITTTEGVEEEIGRFTFNDKSSKRNSKNPLLFGKIPQCCTDKTFYDCILTISEELDIAQELLELGVVETQYANNATLLCEFYNAIKNPEWSLTTDEQIAFMLGILQQGLVTFCCNGQVFIGGAKAFGSLLESNLIPCITIPVVFEEAIGPYCQNSNVILSDFSDNGVEGTWSPSNTVDTSQAGVFDYTFTSLVPPGLDPVTVQIEVLPSTVAPTFDPIGDIAQGYLAQGSVPPVLPPNSTNGIIGTWAPSVIDTNVPFGEYEYIFTPTVFDPTLCPTKFTLLLRIYDPLNPPL